MYGSVGALGGQQPRATWPPIFPFSCPSPCPENKKGKIKDDNNNSPLPSVLQGGKAGSSELWPGDIEKANNLPRVFNNDNLRFVAMSRPDYRAGSRLQWWTAFFLATALRNCTQVRIFIIQGAAKRHEGLPENATLR